MLPPKNALKVNSARRKNAATKDTKVPDKMREYWYWGWWHGYRHRQRHRYRPKHQRKRLCTIWIWNLELHFLCFRLFVFFESFFFLWKHYKKVKCSPCVPSRNVIGLFTLKAYIPRTIHLEMNSARLKKENLPLRIALNVISARRKKKCSNKKIALKVNGARRYKNAPTQEWTQGE